MLNPLVSVVVCAHRTDRYQDLIDAITSLKAQSYAKIEIIMVIDGNLELHEKIKNQANDSRIKVMLNEKNLGLSESRNRGVSRAKGDIIAFFDDDAIADEHWLEYTCQAFHDHPQAGVIGGHIRLVPPEPRPAAVPPGWA